MLALATERGVAVYAMPSQRLTGQHTLTMPGGGGGGGAAVAAAQQQLPNSAMAAAAAGGGPGSAAAAGAGGRVARIFFEKEPLKK